MIELRGTRDCCAGFRRQERRRQVSSDHVIYTVIAIIRIMFPVLACRAREFSIEAKIEKFKEEKIGI